MHRATPARGVQSKDARSKLDFCPGFLHGCRGFLHFWTGRSLGDGSKHGSPRASIMSDVGEVISTAVREKHLGELEELARRTWGEHRELVYVFKDRQRAGVVSRWLRKESRARGYPVTVRQIAERVFVWKNLPPDEEEKAMIKALDSLSYELDGKPGRHLRPV